MYKEYTRDQLSLLMDFQEDIPENHLVRVINDAVNRRLQQYEGQQETLGMQVMAAKKMTLSWTQTTG